MTVKVKSIDAHVTSIEIEIGKYEIMTSPFLLANF